MAQRGLNLKRDEILTPGPNKIVNIIVIKMPSLISTGFCIICFTLHININKTVKNVYCSILQVWPLSLDNNSNPCKGNNKNKSTAAW